MSTLYNNKYDILASTIQPNPASVKYWADLASNPNGGDLKYYNGSKWVLVNAQASEDIKELSIKVNNKVDKIAGKGLSTNDFTNAEKTKLAGLENYNDSEVRTILNNKVDKVSGKQLSTNDFTTAEKTKLAGLNNYSDAELRELISGLNIRLSSLEDRVSALETPAA